MQQRTERSLKGNVVPMSDEGMICTVCSFKNVQGANFCSACGSALADGEPTGAYPIVGVDIPGTNEVGQLIITRGGIAGSRFALSNQQTTIGRHPNSDIFLDDITVSRYHAAVDQTDDGLYTLQDDGSLNGTYVNGARIDTTTLREGDQVQVGKFHMVFVIGVLGESA